MIKGNVLIEHRDEHGKLIESVRGSNTITLAGKNWVANKLTGNARVSSHKLKTPVVEVGITTGSTSLWEPLTLDTTKSTVVGPLATLVGTHTFSLPSRFTASRIRFPSFVPPGSPVGTPPTNDPYTFAQYSLPKPFVGRTGGTITMTWTIRLSYNAANDYDETEVSSVKEGAGSQTTRQLWIRSTDVPIVENRMMAILWDSATATNPSKISHGQVRMYRIDDASLTDDELDELGDAGPFPIIQEDPLINGTFSTPAGTGPGGTEADARINFSFSWAGVGSDTGVLKKRWFFMTLGDSATTANTVRWMAGSHLESDDLPVAATTYTTGIRVR